MTGLQRLALRLLGARTPSPDGAPVPPATTPSTGEDHGDGVDRVDLGIGGDRGGPPIAHLPRIPPTAPRARTSATSADGATDSETDPVARFYALCEQWDEKYRKERLSYAAMDSAVYRSSFTHRAREALAGDEQAIPRRGMREGGG